MSNDSLSRIDAGCKSRRDLNTPIRRGVRSSETRSRSQLNCVGAHLHNRQQGTGICANAIRSTRTDLLRVLLRFVYAQRFLDITGQAKNRLRGEPGVDALFVGPPGGQCVGRAMNDC